MSVPPRTTTPASEPAIEAHALRKRYGDTEALMGLSLTVHQGEIVGLIGPDGSGKTTTMRILCGLLRADEGRARVAGFDSMKQTRALKEHVGYMPQRFSLYPDLTVAENLGFFADLFGLSGDERQRREERLMEFSRLGSFRSRRASQLSGGMKQKLALCSTLIHRPPVLLLDEPTTGVDPVSRREFWSILQELRREGIALLVSTPYMDEATLCDRIVLLHHGRIIAAGTLDQVTQRFPRRLLEIRGVDVRQARLRLLATPTPLITVHRFGDRLHVMHDSDTSVDEVRNLLRNLDVACEPIAPSIEDTFVALMHEVEEVTT